jgi:hypothetical protein
MVAQVVEAAASTTAAAVRIENMRLKRYLLLYLPQEKFPTKKWIL